MQEITEQIRALADPENAKFVARLMPQIPPEQILGCRTPPLRALAKSLGTDSDAVQVFLKMLPHAYFDENQLHAFLIARIKRFDACIAAVEAFLPDKCRMQWWKAHIKEVNRKAVYDFTCACCGQQFQAYGNDHRKYCSRACYIKARFGGEQRELSE